ncbi:MAG: 4Fe-4S dicluster domain-containing protein [Acidobacteria bacterium]|nr:4Fe-4S dicluster domain-containing protein [Acidobacteriota bacterium]
MNQKKKGILFDSTLCIGCGACYEACKEKNHLPQTNGFLKDELSDKTYTIVKKRSGRFVRQMCMHCENPTCASVCPVIALEKTAAGPVIYHEDRCMGCRYCMQACPFNVPKYEWSELQPRVRKCTMCYDRVTAGLPTACAEVCPTGATKFGNRDELIEEARSRIRAQPAHYVNHIYGVEEVGGTSVLLLSDVPIEQLGYRTDLSKVPLPMLTWNVLQKIPNFVAVGSVLLGGIWWITNRRIEVQRAEREEKKRGQWTADSDQ